VKTMAVFNKKSQPEVRQGVNAFTPATNRPTSLETCAQDVPFDPHQGLAPTHL
jgi:hypothetical protein